MFLFIFYLLFLINFFFSNFISTKIKINKRILLHNLILVNNIIKKIKKFFYYLYNYVSNDLKIELF